MLEEFMTRGARIRGLRVRPSRFKRGHTDALWLGPREIAHCHDGQVDVRLTRGGVRELRDELRADARIKLRGPGFDWILVRVRNVADVERALELLRHAMRTARRELSAQRASRA
ncbi:MAG: hypothetical protein E6J13_09910 [Chloroflexi bacterium]|nr:MAG: hypothetical protein E6J13_09910 [Chloroflexota bacterium]